MDQEKKAEWCSRLRSGKYIQGHRYLKSASRYCCLGVLATMAVEGGICSERQRDDGVYLFRGLIAEDGSLVGYLPVEVAAACGVSLAVQKILVDFNDEQGYSFNQIADYIEAAL